MDEEEIALEAEEVLEEAAPPAQPVPPWSPWCDLPPNSRPFAERALMNWVEHVFRSGWPEPAEAVKPCFPWHADAVATLRGLKSGLDGAYAPPVGQDGKITAALIYRMTDWDTDLERAHERWLLSFKRCPDSDGSCYRSKPPSYADLEFPKAAAETERAAQGAWGAVPPDLPPATQPWEVARGIAATQQAASAKEEQGAVSEPEEEGGEPPATWDIAGPVTTW